MDDAIPIDIRDEALRFGEFPEKFEYEGLSEEAGGREDAAAQDASWHVLSILGQSRIAAGQLLGKVETVRCVFSFWSVSVSAQWLI